MKKADNYIVKKIAQGRKETGHTQRTVAEAIGVTYQQYQKYETGRNRVTAARLFLIAKCFGKPIEWFFPEKK